VGFLFIKQPGGRQGGTKVGAGRNRKNHGSEMDKFYNKKLYCGIHVGNVIHGLAAHEGLVLCR